MQLTWPPKGSEFETLKNERHTMRVSVWWGKSVGMGAPRRSVRGWAVRLGDFQTDRGVKTQDTVGGCQVLVWLERGNSGKEGRRLVGSSNGPKDHP